MCPRWRAADAPRGGEGPGREQDEPGPKTPGPLVTSPWPGSSPAGNEALSNSWSVDLPFKSQGRIPIPQTLMHSLIASRIMEPSACSCGVQMGAPADRHIWSRQEHKLRSRSQKTLTKGDDSLLPCWNKSARSRAVPRIAFSLLNSCTFRVQGLRGRPCHSAWQARSACRCSLDPLRRRLKVEGSGFGVHGFWFRVEAKPNPIVARLALDPKPWTASWGLFRRHAGVRFVCRRRGNRRAACCCTQAPELAACNHVQLPGPSSLLARCFCSRPCCKSTARCAEHEWDERQHGKREKKTHMGRMG